MSTTHAAARATRKPPAAEGRAPVDAGAEGATLAPPHYGIDFVDRGGAAPAAGSGVAQRKPAGSSATPATGMTTGLPAALRAGIESMSGLAMDGVKVHYNSPRPRGINAAAYAQGRDIHLAPGQERHLPHEAWHVVQQAQGRVPVTQRTGGGVALNDSSALEHEADTMGARAAQRLEAPTRTDEDDLADAGTTTSGAAAAAVSGMPADSTAFQLADIPSGAEEAERQADDQAPTPRQEGGVTQRLFSNAVPTVFPSFYRILASPTVQFHVHKAWLETLAACSPAGRREQGFWITWNSYWDSFSVTGHGTGPVVGPGVGATINLPAKPADAHPTYTVASFHTHTPTTYRTVGRAVGPSGADVTADTADNVAGIVYDFWGDGSGNLPAGRSRAWPARLYQSRNRRV